MLKGTRRSFKIISRTCNTECPQVEKSDSKEFWEKSKKDLEKLEQVVKQVMEDECKKRKDQCKKD